jgi:hypothetical protein
MRSDPLSDQAAEADTDGVQVGSLNRRREPRVRSTDGIRLLVDAPGGLTTLTGSLVDLSERGCALRLNRRVTTEQVGRVRVDIGGTAFWLPVITRWVRERSDGWTVGCEFDRPTAEKQQAIHALLLERERIAV